jgi:hypothetical protein
VLRLGDLDGFKESARLVLGLLVVALGRRQAVIDYNPASPNVSRLVPDHLRPKRLAERLSRTPELRGEGYRRSFPFLSAADHFGDRATSGGWRRRRGALLDYAI